LQQAASRLLFQLNNLSPVATSDTELIFARQQIVPRFETLIFKPCNE